MVTPKSGGLEGPDVTPPSWDTTAQDLTRHLAEGGDLDADTLERLADAAQEARKADHGSPVTLYRWRDIPKPPPRSWVVTDWIPAGCLSVIVGAGGYGKSTLAIQLAAAVASGAGGSDEWMIGAAIDGLPLGNAVPADGAPAVYACWEDDAPEITRRLAAMSGEAAPWLNPNIDLHIAPLRGEGPLWEAQGRYELAGPTSLAHQLQAAVDQLDPAPALVILDSVAAIYSDDENDRRSVRGLPDLGRPLGDGNRGRRPPGGPSAQERSRLFGQLRLAGRSPVNVETLQGEARDAAQGQGRGQAAGCLEAGVGQGVLCGATRRRPTGADAVPRGLQLAGGRPLG